LDTYKVFIQSIRWQQPSKPKCFQGLALTITGIKSLLLDLKCEGFSHVNTRKLQQDCLENLFSIVRMKGGWSRNPSAREMRQRFKFMFLKCFVFKSRNSNVQVCVTDDMSFNLHLLNSLFSSKLSNEDDQDDNEIDENKFEPEPHELGEVGLQGKDKPCSSFFSEYTAESSNPNESHNIAVYLGGYCVKKIISRYNCDSCKLLLSEQVSSNNNSHFLAYEKSYFKNAESTSMGDKVQYTDAIDVRTTAIVSYVLKTFVARLNDVLTNQQENVLKKVQEAYMKIEGIDLWVKDGVCNGHRGCIISLLLRVLLYRLVKDKNDNCKQPKSWSQKRIDLRNQ